MNILVYREKHKILINREELFLRMCGIKLLRLHVDNLKLNNKLHGEGTFAGTGKSQE